MAVCTTDKDRQTSCEANFTDTVATRSFITIEHVADVEAAAAGAAVDADDDVDVDVAGR